MSIFSGIMTGVLLLTTVSVRAETVETTNTTPITVYRSPTCGCCEKWLTHLTANGFLVEDHITDDVQAVKNKHHISAQLASCHTSLVNGYVVEGHVPADAIKQLLKSKLRVAGISVPGMPVGTPGMEMGDKKDPYYVISFDNNNQVEIFE
jgi:hypothetical protein